MTEAERGQIETLEAAVNEMDRLSQGGFSEIAAVARLALTALETPDGWRHMGDIEEALNIILSKAQDVENCINCEAERVGCNYKDVAQRRRWEALAVAREAGHD